MGVGHEWSHPQVGRLASRARWDVICESIGCIEKKALVPLIRLKQGGGRLVRLAPDASSGPMNMPGEPVRRAS